MPRVPDERLMTLAQEGDLEAFEQIVERHKRVVFSLALGMLRTREDAEEATQDTFVKLFRHRDSYDAARAFEPWLLRVAGNTCRDMLRRRRAARLPLAYDADGNALAHLIEDRGEARDTATEDAIRHELAQLTDRHREPLVLKYVHGFTNQQIADALGISISNVKVRIARAKEVLQSRLQRMLGG